MRMTAAAPQEPTTRTGTGVDKARKGAALFEACRDGDTKKVKTLLLDSDQDIDARRADYIDFTDQTGRTPLYVASAEGHVEVVKLLLEFGGAKIDREDDHGATPLYVASQYGHTDVVQVLLDAGGPSIMDVFQRTGRTPLCIASQNGHLETVKVLAAAKDQYPSDNDVGVDERNTDGLTPLLMASIKGQTDMIVTLIEAGADIHAQCVAKGATPLHAACMCGHVETANLLIKLGAQIDFCCNDGKTPLDWAIMFEQHHMIDALAESISDGGSAATAASSVFVYESITTTKVPQTVQEIHLPKTLTQIPAGAFVNLHRLSSVTFEEPSQLSSLSPHIFEGCGQLPTLIVPDSVTLIDSNAFEQCSALTYVVLPQNNRLELANHAFLNCKSLVLLALSPDTKCPPSVLEGCTTLQTVLGRDKPLSDIVEWLKHRFDDLPLHRICYAQPEALTLQQVEKHLQQPQDNATSATDKAGLTVLHILMMHPTIPKDCIEAVLKVHPSLSTVTDIRRQNPLHVLCGHHRATDGGGATILSLVQSIIAAGGPNICSYLDQHFDLPLALAIRSKLPQEILQYLYACYPIQASQVETEAGPTVAKLEDGYWPMIRSMCEGKVVGLSTAFQHGLVEYFSHVVSESHMKEIVDFLLDHEHCSCETASLLAKAHDQFGRTVLDTAKPALKKVLQERLLFLGRYELSQGPPIHKSATSIVIKAIDKQRAIEDHSGQHPVVVFKFIRDQDHFLREQSRRENLEQVHDKADQDSNSRYVVSVLDYFVSSNNKAFERDIKATKSHPGGVPDLSDYHYAMLMPFADRSLDCISKYERPDEMEVRVLAKQMAESLGFVHDRNLIHGDFKQLNVVRINNRLKLIDFDASVELSSPVGAKFSSGILPPEMVARLEDENAYAMYQEYFSEAKKRDSSDELWQKVAPKVDRKEGCCYVVKTFLTETVPRSGFGREWEEEQVVTPELLPYGFAVASRTIDIWSFGVVLYNLITRSSLFDTTDDDDFNDARAMRELYLWTDEIKRQKLERVADPSAKDLLSRLLARDPTKRPQCMQEVLNYEYFSLKADAAKELRALVEKLNEQTIKVDKILEATESFSSVLENSVSNLMRAIYDATEVMTPTSFVLLERKLEDGEMESERGIEKADKRLGLFETLTSMAGSFLGGDDGEEGEEEDEDGEDGEPKSFVAKLRNLRHNTLYLYLVDEYTNKPVYDHAGVYPLQIKTDSEVAEQILPFLMVGLQAIAAVNGAAALVSMFYPVFPGRIIPRGWKEKAEEFVQGTSVPDVLQSQVQDRRLVALEAGGERAISDDGPCSTKTVRGAELRELVSFFAENDTDSTFSGLQRVYEEKTGRAMWVTAASYEAMQREGRPGQQQLQLTECESSALQSAGSLEVKAQAPRPVPAANSNLPLDKSLDELIEEKWGKPAPGAKVVMDLEVEQQDKPQSSFEISKGQTVVVQDHTMQDLDQAAKVKELEAKVQVLEATVSELKDQMKQLQSFVAINHSAGNNMIGAPRHRHVSLALQEQALPKKQTSRRTSLFGKLSRKLSRKNPGKQTGNSNKNLIEI